MKLIALDSEDLKVISSYCQDAVLKVGDLQYFAEERRFVLALNRYAWEVDGDQQRHKSVIHFDQVNSVKVQGVSQSDKDQVISILAILFESDSPPEGQIEIVLAGDGAIRLDVECIEAKLSDLPAAWKASSTPSHE